ncbi:MAG: hypothetical protein HDS50_01015 [Bacteroides sp.]|nr:hypothetical protein [Bacteroides sp.]
MAIKNSPIKMKRKKVILTLSRVFPKTHSKAGITTLFAVNLFAGRKIHTIRADEKGLWAQKVADINTGKKMLCVREWTGRPYNSEQADIKSYVQIGLQDITMTFDVEDAKPKAWVDGKPVSIETLAKNDGLTESDFVEWFFGSVRSGNVFKGKIIHFTDFRY